MSLGRRLIGDTVVYGTALAVSRAAAFALLPVFTRVFTVAEYGTYDLAMAFTRALFVPAVLGLDVGVALMLQRRLAGTQGRAVSSCLAAQVTWGALVLGALLPFSGQISEILFGDRDHTGIVWLAVLFLAVLVVNNFATAVLKWKREPLAYLLLTVASSGLATAASLGFVLLGGRGVSGALAGLVVGSAACVPLAIAFLAPHLGRPVSFVDVAEGLKLGLPFAAVSASELIFPFLLRLLLFSVGDLSAVGVFGAANTICLGILLINDAFASAWWPYVLSPDAQGRALDDTARVMRLYAFFLIVLAAALSLLAHPLVTLVLGGGAYGGAAAAVPPLALAYWLKCIRQNVNVGLVLTERNWARAALNIVTLAVALGLAYRLTTRWGVQGAAWGFACGEALGLAFQSALMRRLYKLRTEFRAPALMALGFLALTLIAGVLPSSAIGLQVAERGALMMLFVATLLWLRVAALREVTEVLLLTLRLGRATTRMG